MNRKFKKELSKTIHKDTKKWSSQIREERKRRPPIKEDIWNKVKNGYEIIKIRTIEKNFSSYEELKIKIISLPVDIVDAFKNILKKVIDDQKLVQGDKIRLVINHHSIDTPKSSKFQIIPKENVEEFILSHNEVFLKFVEYKNLPLDEIDISVHWVKVPRGSGRKKANKLNLYSKKSVIYIRNNDTTCLARSVVTAYANKFGKKCSNGSKLTESELKNGINKSRMLQEEEAYILHKNAGVEIKKEGNTYEDAAMFARYLNVEINILNGDLFGTLDFTTGKGESLYILKNGKHFDTVTNIKGFVGKAYWCNFCKKSYTKKDCHKCPLKCECCFKEGKCSGRNIKCEKCNRTFFGKECYEEHIRDRGSSGIVCEKVRKCLECKKIDDKDHRCGYEECDNCKEKVKKNKHLCYMIKKEKKGGECTREGKCKEIKNPLSRCLCCRTKTEKYIFYDFECNQETGEHIVNYAHAENYYGNEYTFKNIDEFCKFAINYKDYTFIAHNAKGYDLVFIYRWSLENYSLCGDKPFIILRGKKIMYMSIKLEKGKIKFIDFLNFVKTPLSNFPKIFGIKELKKGFFPYLFNTDENQNYVGKIPDMKYFCPESMSIERREEFLEWYKEQTGVHNFAKEMSEYCKSDVGVLREGCKNLRENFLETQNIDPLQYVTIASTCMAIFRCNYLFHNSIAIVKEKFVENYSEKSIGWLKSIERDEGIKIQHALNGGEVKIEKMRVDGYCKENNTVYEFQGCFWHGCEKCYKSNTHNPKVGTSIGELNERTKKKNGKITKKGYKLVEIKECDYIDENVDDIVGPLNPRDAFFGGRTNVIKLLCENVRIKYADIFSLYPAVMFYDRYPVGHPVKIIEPEKIDEKWFGLIKCKVIPPRGLYHPVLPVKIDNLLMFPLCKKCAEKKIGKCKHGDEERSFIGTWCSNEINKAIEKGYKIDKMYEVWHFEETSTELFKDYIRTFLKIKIENSHPPILGGEFKSLDHFREVVKEKYDIEIGEIKYNPGMREIAKLCLKSLWGKFAQRINLPQTAFVTSVEEFIKYIEDDTLENVEEIYENDELCFLSYCKKDEFEDNRNNVNIYIAEFTTANARMRLYDILDKLKEQIVAFDTDGIWYMEGKMDIKLGCLLGDLEDELKGDTINNWGATGPKSYFYTTVGDKYECKTKGFTLNYESSKKINKESILQLIKKEIKEIITTNDKKITRDLKEGKIINKREDKKLKITCDKRVVLENYDSLPFGY